MGWNRVQPSSLGQRFLSFEKTDIGAAFSPPIGVARESLLRAAGMLFAKGSVSPGLDI